MVVREVNFRRTEMVGFWCVGCSECNFNLVGKNVL